MNKVLTRLTTEGYILRRRRGGTFVAQPRGQAAVMEINDIEHEVQELGLPYDWRLTSIDVRPPLEAERALLEMPSDYTGNTIVLEGVHFARGEPFCLELRAINLDVAPEASKQDFSITVPG